MGAEFARLHVSRVEPFRKGDQAMHARVILAAMLLVATLGCATGAPPADPQSVTVIERNREGETSFALPTTLEGCTYLGAARVSIPEGVRGLPPDIVDQLKQRAAKKGGNTLVLLPGKRIDRGALRGSVFQCATPPA
jgi:hypothetical protein